MTKAPTPTEMSKGQSDNTNNATKKFDYTAVADRLRKMIIKKISPQFCVPYFVPGKQTKKYKVLYIKKRYYRKLCSSRTRVILHGRQVTYTEPMESHLNSKVV